MELKTLHEVDVDDGTVQLTDGKLLTMCPRVQQSVDIPSNVTQRLSWAYKYRFQALYVQALYWCQSQLKTRTIP